MSEAHRSRLLARPLDPETSQRYQSLASLSLDEQRAEEAGDTMSFEAWRQQYLQLPSIEGLTAEAADATC